MRTRNQEPDDATLEALASALKKIPVPTEHAWQRVWTRVRSDVARPTPRWPVAASLSLVTALLVVSNLGLTGSLAGATAAVATIPGPHIALQTPARDVTGAPVASTSSATMPGDRPGRASTPQPNPLPPDPG
jgi:hypothetical protein